MSLISSIAKSFNFKIPESISNISGKGFVDTVKNLAKVAGDTFLAPSTDGKSLFNSEINILGMRLPNPVNALAEKLLGAAGEKVRELGFSTDAIANMFNGARNVLDVGETTLPSLSERITDLATTRTDGVGGGVATTRSTTAAAAAAVPVTNGVGGSTTTSTTTTGADFATSALEKFGGSLSGLDGEINSLINKGGELSQTEMLKLQQKMQRRNELYQMLSQIMSMEHETKRSIIGNIR